MLSCEFTVAEQSVFDLRQSGRISLQRLFHRLQLRQRFVDFDRRTVDRRQGGLQGLATATLGGAFERAIGLIQARISALAGGITALAISVATATAASAPAVKSVGGLLDRFLNPGHVGKQAPPCFQPRDFADFGGQLFEFLGRVAEI
ncbi:MAG: Uncharacterised protein [Rhodospirillaceae bacterium]|nr:MAG: Uncharacterised protein [Rhodospirillaceae bacterium]